MAKQTIRAALEAIDTKVRRAVDDAMEDAAYDAKREFQSIVGRWKNKPTFTTERTVYASPETWEYVVKPTGRFKKIFTYVDKGTRGPYLIPKVITPGKPLRFQTGYQARTAPVARYNVGSGTANGAWVSKGQVSHPGIKKRDFSQNFIDDLSPPLDMRVNSAIKKAL